MAGIKGAIEKAKGPHPRTVYMSDIFGVWLDGDTLYLSNQKGDQDLVQAVTPADGLFYQQLLLLYHYGLR